MFRKNDIGSYSFRLIYCERDNPIGLGRGRQFSRIPFRSTPAGPLLHDVTGSFEFYPEKRERFSRPFVAR